MQKVKYFLSTLLLIFMIAYINIIFAITKYDAIQKKKQIVIGVNKDYPPLHYIQSGVSKGVEHKMIKSLSDFLNASVKLVEINIGNMIPSLLNNTIDIAIAGISQSLERAKKITYTKPYLNIYPAILISQQAIPQRNYGDIIESKGISNFDDIRKIINLTIAIKKYSVYENLVKEYFPKVEYVLVDDYHEAIASFKNGKVNAFLHDSILLEFLQNNDNYLFDKSILVMDTSKKEYISIALNIHDIILKNQLDIWITELIRTGTINLWLGK